MFDRYGKYIRRKLLLLLAILTVISSGTQTQGKEIWEKLGENAVGTHFYDKSSVKSVKPGLIKVWSKIIYSQRAIEQATKVIPEAAGIHQQVDLDVIDCTNNQYILSRIIYYDKNGKVLHDTGEDKGLGYRPIPENTPIERLSKAVCKFDKI